MPGGHAAAQATTPLTLQVGKRSTHLMKSQWYRTAISQNPKVCTACSAGHATHTSHSKRFECTRQRPPQIVTVVLPAQAARRRTWYARVCALVSMCVEAGGGGVRWPQRLLTARAGNARRRTPAASRSRSRRAPPHPCENGRTRKGGEHVDAAATDVAQSDGAAMRLVRAQRCIVCVWAQGAHIQRKRSPHARNAGASSRQIEQA